MNRWLARDINLISIRSRAGLNHPFIVVKEMEAKAEAAHREKQKKLIEEKQQVEAKLRELQASRKDKSQRFIATPEQAAEIKKFESRAIEVKREQKMLDRELRRDVETLQVWTKLWNIFTIPLCVVAFGIGFES